MLLDRVKIETQAIAAEHVAGVLHAQIGKMRELVPAEHQSEFIELLRQYSVIHQVSFRMSQIDGSFTDGSGDAFSSHCIRSLPAPLNEIVATNFDVVTGSIGV